MKDRAISLTGLIFTARNLRLAQDCPASLAMTKMTLKRPCGKRRTFDPNDRSIYNIEAW